MTALKAPELDRLRDPGLLVPHIKVRLQRGGKGANGLWGMGIAYIDARAAATILDEALGPFGWSFESGDPVKLPSGWMVTGRLTLHLHREGGTISVHRCDMGSGNSGGDSELETGAKGAVSDCLKRCAAMFGVGRPIYRLPDIWIKAEDLEVVKEKVVLKRGKDAGYVQACQQTLREWAEKFASRTSQPAPAVPAGMSVDPETGEVSSSEEWAKAIDAAAQTLGAPGSETPTWGPRWAWMVQQDGDDEQVAKGTIAAVLGSTAKTKLTEPDAWLRVLTHYAERADAQRARAA